MFTADCRFATPAWKMVIIGPGFIGADVKLRDFYLPSNEPGSEKLLELWRVELGWIEALLEKKLLLLGGGQLLGRQVPVGRVHVQSPQLSSGCIALQIKYQLCNI